MRLLITGTTGYIGHQLALAAVAKGHKVHALVRDCFSPNRPVHDNITYFKGDLNNRDAIAAAMNGCDAVLHAAAMAQLWNRNRSLFYKVNVEGTRNMLEAALALGIKKFVFTSSCAVLGPSYAHPVCEDDPRLTPFDNDYEISKHCAEELVRAYADKALFAMIVCPPRVYGPGPQTSSNPITALIKRMLKTGVAVMPSATEVVANYAFIDDVVEGHFLALEKGRSREKYTLGGENISYRQFFTTIRNEGDRAIRLFTVPKLLLKSWSSLVFSACYITGKHTNLSPRTIDRLYQNRAVSCEKAVQQLGYTITPFQQGVQQTIQYLKTTQHV